MSKHSLHLFLATALLVTAAGSAIGVSKSAHAANSNLLAGRTYTASAAASTSYPDSGSELTDGLYAAPLLADSAWQGRLGATGEEAYSFKADLGSAQTFQSFKSNFFKYTGAAVQTPLQVAFQYSNDDSTYADACSVSQQGADLDTAAIPYQCSAPAPITAQYVKMTVTGEAGKWSFVDEWEVREPSIAGGGSTPTGAPLLAGSFLQPDLGNVWTDTQWATEFQRMKEVGMDHLFLQWSANSRDHTTVYPSSLSGYTQNTSKDVVAKSLGMGNQYGVDIYMGLQLNEDWFSKYANDQAWLNNEATMAKNLAQDLWTKYGSNPSFKGWYLSFEVDNWNFPTSMEWNRMSAFYNNVITYIKTLSPNLPIIVSPFYNTSGGLTPSGWQTMWESILTNSSIDIIALQDGIGAGHAVTSQLPAWFSATKSAIANARPTTALWDDAETFNMDFKPMDIKLLKNDLAAVQPYVTKFTSFSFNHYMSPQQVNPLYFATYKNYYTSGAVDAVAPSAPAGLSASAANSMTVQLNWTGSTDDIGVVGYKVYRNNELVYTSYMNTSNYTDVQLNPSTVYSYTVRAFDAAGNDSAASTMVAATTPAGTTYATNLAQGKSYTFSSPADTAYPDTGGLELTDGVLGAAAYTDTAWQGRSTGSPYSFIIDLGSSKTIQELYADFLQVKSVYVLLPQSVHFSVSSNGSSFTAVGTVNKPAVGNSDQTKKYRLTDLTGVTGRYVKVEVVPASSTWTFIDEIQVRS